MQVNLLPWQIPHCARLQDAIYNTGHALDASDTGTGKTICAIKVARELDMQIFVVTRKSTIPTWKYWIEQMWMDGFLPHDQITNYEMARKHGIPNLENTLYVFDEVHEASGYKTQNAHLLMGVCAMKRPILMLSATVAETPLKMYALGYVLGLHNGTDFYRWTMDYGCHPSAFIRGAWVFGDRTENMEKLHNVIFPAHGSRMRKAEIPNFPEILDIVECVELGDPIPGIAPYRARLQERAAEYAANMTLDPSVEYALDGSGMNQNQLVEVLYDRMEIELDKVGVLLKMIEDALEEGLSVVVFVNFRWTIEALIELSEFPALTSVIIGGQDPREREITIQSFQANQTRVMLATLGAGSEGISLHDLHGNHPRISFICPTYRAVALRQAMGRIHRAGAKSKAINKLIFATGTVEAKVARSVQNKLKNLDSLNDGDLCAE